MKKSAIVIATLLALSAGTASANTEVLNGFTGKIEAEYTTQDKHANVETQLGYDFNFGAVSVIPFFAAETAYSGERNLEDGKREGFDKGGLGGGIKVQTNFDNFYAYVEGRAMRKDRLKLQGPTPELSGYTPAGAEIFTNSTVKEYRGEIGTGYIFDNGLSAGVEASFTQDRFEDFKDEKREVFAVAGYQVSDNFNVYLKAGRADTAELKLVAVPSSDSLKGEWETKTVIGLTYKF
ncbi:MULTISPECIES: hypothetical protein [unclassified Shewanella]|uniref:hypothetical protein n=1 Tax=unclassified Shewanella TaxID=196818 RepID=UPI000C7BB668|nr:MULTISPECIES: hypothetical protein [unclassified Shewanella]PKG55227.1 hypothetical protein CXF82_20575 [Shewanella sp. GutDb-MelDb]PKG73585.1 hypothetical protein CXF86_16535 [Shewanella sp. GutCb]